MSKNRKSIGSLKLEIFLWKRFGTCPPAEPLHRMHRVRGIKHHRTVIMQLAHVTVWPTQQGWPHKPYPHRRPLSESKIPALATAFLRTPELMQAGAASMDVELHPLLPRRPKRRATTVNGRSCNPLSWELQPASMGAVAETRAATMDGGELQSASGGAAIGLRGSCMW